MVSKKSEQKQPMQVPPIVAAKMKAETIDKPKKDKKTAMPSPPALNIMPPNVSDTTFKINNKEVPRDAYYAQIEKNKIIDKQNKEREEKKVIAKKEAEVQIEKNKKINEANKNKKDIYKIGDKKVTKEEFEAAKVDPDKRSEYELDGKKVTKEEFNAAKNPPKLKTYIVNGKKASKEEFDAAKQFNEMKKTNTSGKGEMTDIPVLNQR